MNSETKNPEVPSKEQIINWYKEQIEITTLRRDLSALQMEIAKNEAQRTQATILMAQMQSPASQNEVEHIVTQEDLDANPELVENNVKVGDKILVNNPTAITEQPSEIDPGVDDNTPVKKLKKV
jgi:hypothetical protein